MPGSEPRELRTERLLLRPFRPGDVDAVARYATDEKYLRFLSPTHPEPEEFVAHNVDVDWSVERSWVITLGREIVGSLFLGINEEDDAAELACLVAPEFWRRGIAFEASCAVVGHAFGELGLGKVVARADARHESSIGLMAKLGMQPHGERRGPVGRDGADAGELIYGVLRDDWQPPA